MTGGVRHLRFDSSATDFRENSVFVTLALGI
jgi:hypothetical protein